MSLLFTADLGPPLVRMVELARDTALGRALVHNDLYSIRNSI
jgi:hypothetical protein